MDYFDDCLFKENENEQLSIEKNTETLEVYKKCINWCGEIASQICDLTGKKFLGYSKTSIILLVHRLLHLSQAIRILTIKGYFSEVSILHRTFLEGLGLCVLFSKNSEAAKNWLFGKKVKVPSIKLVTIITEMIPTVKYNMSLQSLYGKLCDEVHTNMAALQRYLDYSNAEEKIFDGEKFVTVNIRRTPFDHDKHFFNLIPHYPLLVMGLLWTMYNDDIPEDQRRKYLEDFNNIVNDYSLILKK